MIMVLRCDEGVPEAASCNRMDGQDGRVITRDSQHIVVMWPRSHYCSPHTTVYRIIEPFVTAGLIKSGRVTSLIDWSRNHRSMAQTQVGE